MTKSRIRAVLDEFATSLGEGQATVARFVRRARHRCAGAWGALWAGSIQGTKNFLYTLDKLKELAVLCLAFAVFMIVPDQSLELYRYTAQSLARTFNSDFAWQDLQGLFEAVILVVSMCALSALLVAAASILYALRHQAGDGGPKRHFSSTAFSVLACVPCSAVAIGMFGARIDLGAPQLKEAMLAGARLSFQKDVQLPELITKLAEFDVNSQLYINEWLYAGAIALLLLSAACYLVCSLWFRGRQQFASPSAARSVRLVISGIGLPILLSGVFILFPVGLPRAMTAFGVICLFFGVIALSLVAIGLLHARLRMPLLFLLTVAAVVFTLTGLNDNHGVRELTEPPAGQPVHASQSIGDGFADWLGQRKDLGQYQTYPVYVVAAEGGGIYAAFRTAAYLTSLQDQCPRFSHHLFAISSVSGGSVGAVIYNGLTRKIKLDGDRFSPGHGCRPDGDGVGGLYFTDVAEDILQDDFLSPVLAGFLFPDFIQRFLFFPILGLDRAIALEKSLEQSWDNKVRSYYDRFRSNWIDDGNALRDSVAQSWSSDGDSPALFLNTTEIESGRGRVISPFSIKADEFSSLPLLRSPQDGSHPGVDLALVTAAVLSARFPWLTPPGSIQIAGSKDDQSATSAPSSPQNKVQLVDGAYLDNSGVSAALAIVQAMEAAILKMSSPPKIEINLIVLTSARFTNPKVMADDYSAPIQALLSARAARSSIAIAQAERILKQTGSESRQGNEPTSSFAKAVLQGYGYPLPLGWRLSPITRLLILGQNGDAGSCASGSDGPDCLRARIYQELSK